MKLKLQVASALFLCCIFLASVTGCSDSDSDSNTDNKIEVDEINPITGLPLNPRLWVCPSTPVSQAEKDAWCLQNMSNRGTPWNPGPPPSINSELAAKNEYDKKIKAFLHLREYDTRLNWLSDPRYRFAGPYVGDVTGDGTEYATHIPIRIFYSPEAIAWMCTDREGTMPDGTMIIKELHAFDGDPVDQGGLNIEIDSDGCMVSSADNVEPQGWAVMIKDQAGSNDGWYWVGQQIASLLLEVDPPIKDLTGVTDEFLFYKDVGNPPLSPDPNWYPSGWYNSSGASTGKTPNVIAPVNAYSNACSACHSSALLDSTYADISNLLGKSIRYKNFPAPDNTEITLSDVSANENIDTPYTIPLQTANTDFLTFYNQIGEQAYSSIWPDRFPAQTYDHVNPLPNELSFMTSDQCETCHNANAYLGLPNTAMAIKDEETSLYRNFSPYGEWQNSPLGLAGRDPIFFAQLESELNMLPAEAECIENTCLSCHAVMGQRQYATDNPTENNECSSFVGVTPPEGFPVGAPFREDFLFQWPGANDREKTTYAGLGRDGISCMVCHTMSDKSLGESDSFTGHFVSGILNKIKGPYSKDIVKKPMQNMLGVEPQFDDVISDSGLCGSCHNILLPVFNTDGSNSGAFHYEQATHLEWLNSIYSKEPKIVGCINCHMPDTYNENKLAFKIANFESSAYPPTTNRIPDSETTAITRTSYRRHTLHGLNVFLNEFAQQFPFILGFRQEGFYNVSTTTYPGLVQAAESIKDMASNNTIAISTEIIDVSPGSVKISVNLSNLAGHFVPSGVSFRRVFIEVLAYDDQDQLVFASGRTNNLGALLNGITDDVLPSEDRINNPKSFQPHYQLITDGSQVQIYQDVTADSDGDLTSLFLQRATTLKGNRLRPKGYSTTFYETFTSPFIQELDNIYGEAVNDPDYTTNVSDGGDTIQYLISRANNEPLRIEVSVFNQSIPPNYLQERFSQATTTSKHTKRLHYMGSRLRTDEQSNIEDWKLQLGNTEILIP